MQLSVLRAFVVDCKSQSAQASAEMIILIPILFMMMFGIFQFGRVFWTYHTLQKALRGGAGMLAKASNINYCNPSDPGLLDARNFIVFGNLQGLGDPVVNGLTTEMIQVVPERIINSSTAVDLCPCGDTGSCDVSAGGTAPDFITINITDGFPVDVRFPYSHMGAITLKVSVRMPVTGG